MFTTAQARSGQITSSTWKGFLIATCVVIGAITAVHFTPAVEARQNGFQQLLFI
jgi:hypothetical protein